MLLARLAEGAATVNELAEPFALTLPAVSEHLKVLEQAGLVVRGRTRVVLTHRGIAADSPGATGWAMALDALEEALAIR